MIASKRGCALSKIACVAVVRDEERHIAEWLAWQFMIGFDTVMLIDHGSTDGTATVARAMAERHDIRLVAWPPADQEVQSTAYGAAARALAGEFDWLAYFDTDEFLVLDEGLALKPLLDARPEAAVAVPWAIFGSAGHVDIPDALVTAAFCRRSLADFPPNRHVKSIIRPGRMIRPINPHVFEIQGETAGLRGERLAFAAPGYLADAPVYSGAKLHHYFTRSRAHWQRRLKRGGLKIVRTEQEFFDYDRNELFDDAAARAAPQLTAMIAGLTPAPAPPVPPRFGIAITTMNRCAMVTALVRQIAELTTTPYDLVVCDDGSTDDTVETLRLMGVTVITGPNRGIAWNKNRGLYHLLNIARSDIVLLLDDDVRLGERAWERGWIDAARRHGHVNLVYPGVEIFSGTCTPAEPGLVTFIGGVAIAFTRQVLTEIGYFDVRFGRYGHEHTELTFRAIRAGYGGIAAQNGGRTQIYFFVIDSPIEHVYVSSAGSAEERDANGAIMATIAMDAIYRPAWRTDEQMQLFLSELAAAQLVPSRCRIHLNSYETLADYEQRDTVPSDRQETATALGLIFDIGMSEGNDTAFYLAKGFNVVGVEADVHMFEALQERFAGAIEAGNLVIHHRAAGARHGEIVEFFGNPVHQGISGLTNNDPPTAHLARRYHVMTIDWPALIARHGTPYYVKIDIEGAEASFLSSWGDHTPLPAYVSAECHSFAPVEALYELGYRRFQLIDQNPPGGFRLPPVQREGRRVDWPRFEHASGPFGRDLTGPWVDFEMFRRQFDDVQERRNVTWFDCHAWAG
jgi:FkbM family methyltransferase